jgi:hypothetical protein
MLMVFVADHLPSRFSIMNSSKPPPSDALVTPSITSTFESLNRLNTIPGWSVRQPAELAVSKVTLANSSGADPCNCRMGWLTVLVPGPGEVNVTAGGVVSSLI